MLRMIVNTQPLKLVLSTYLLSLSSALSVVSWSRSWGVILVGGEHIGKVEQIALEAHQFSFKFFVCHNSYAIKS